jgi:outer membrane lipoprotein-sorting protein
MKKILSALVLAVALTGHTATAQTDAKAKAILEATSKKVGSLKSLKANFALKLAGGNGKVRESRKGSFLMKGQKYHVSLPGQEIICDGRTVWTYMKDGNEVQVSNYNPSEQTVSPTKLFTNFYDKEYTYRYVGARTVAGKPCDIVEMVPLNKSKQFSKIELAVDKTSNIVGGNVWEKNGNQYQYEVSAYTPNAAVADAQFTFNAKAHPGVEVVDLR